MTTPRCTFTALATTLLAVAGVAAGAGSLSGCTAVPLPTAQHDDADQKTINAIENRAQRKRVNVIWINPPEDKAPDTPPQPPLPSRDPS